MSFVTSVAETDAGEWKEGEHMTQGVRGGNNVDMIAEVFDCSNNSVAMATASSERSNTVTWLIQPPITLSPYNSDK